MQIEMVDLKNQYLKIKPEIDAAILECVGSTSFINGPSVRAFQKALEEYLENTQVITCGNGTDSLQIAMMALDLKPGDEVICPAFTYVATAEVVSLLGLVPKMVDVDPNTFNLDFTKIEEQITSRTKAIVPVHLYGQSCDMEPIIAIAKKNNLYVIEDNAQAIGATYTFSDGKKCKAGNIGDIGSTSFFPSKNLGCFGDGGALMTKNKDIASKIKMIANHGQSEKYLHKYIGCNSRLDSIQAAILNIKLKYLDSYISNRQKLADYYDNQLDTISAIQTPYRSQFSSHVFHQYTIKVFGEKRNDLKNYLATKGIPSMIYYPMPLYKQEAYSNYVPKNFQLENTEMLCKTVLSLPMHTEMTYEQMEFICTTIKNYFK